MVLALRDRLRGHARAVLDTSALHIQADLYLVDDRHEDRHHALGVEGGTLPPSGVRYVCLFTFGVFFYSPYWMRIRCVLDAH